jgi:polyhydroxybutyrate depolymerase
MCLCVFPLLALVACASEEPPGGPEFQLACHEPRDGGVFATGLTAPVAGCALSGQPSGVLDLEQLGWLTAGGVLVVPPAAAAGTALPAFIVFHGAGSTGELVRQNLGIEAAADGGAVFVYPNAPRASRTWDVGRNAGDGTDALLRRLTDSYCIDPERIYIAGHSAGAVYTLYLGCNVPSTFGGMAVVAGSDARFDTRCCKGSISAIFIHGTEDEAINIVEGRSARGRTQRRDGCTDTSVPDGPNCVSFDCPAPWSVDACEWLGGHEAPPWAGEEIWRFFSAAP